MYSPIRGGSISPIERSHTPTASDFPVPASQEFKVTKRDKGLVSPSQSSFSFIDDFEVDQQQRPIHAITSPRRIESRTPSRNPSRAPSRKNSIDLSRARGASIDGAAGYLCNGIADNDDVAHETGKTRNQFYTEVFSYREPNISPKDRIYSDAIVTVEVKTNVIVHDEYHLLSSLTTHLSLLFSLPPTSILLSLSHSCCMLFGGTFDSAYILTITSLPHLLTPSKNKKNASLLQAWLAGEGNLGVSPARGVVRFWGLGEGMVGWMGSTVRGVRENCERDENQREEREKEERERGEAELRGKPNQRAGIEKDRREEGERREEGGREMEIPPRLIIPSRENALRKETDLPSPRPPPLLLKKQQSTRSYKMIPTTNHQHNTSAWMGTQSVPVSRAASPPCAPRVPEKGGWVGEKGGWVGEKGGWIGAEKKNWRGGREVGVGGRVVGKRKSFFNFWGGRGREG